MKIEVKIPLVLMLLAMMWALQLLQLLIPGIFYGVGIHPRTLAGFGQILIAPWLHHGLYHIAANTIPFLLLGLMIELQSRRDFLVATLVITLVAGLGTWLFGSSGIHRGASSLVFGYWAYLLASAWLLHNLKSLLLAMVAIFIYGGLLMALTDFRSHISWSGHFFGLLGGILAAVMMAKWQRHYTQVT